MDQTDGKILDILQTNASLSTVEVAGQAGIDEEDCAGRIQRLENEGVLLQKVALPQSFPFLKMFCYQGEVISV